MATTAPAEPTPQRPAGGGAVRMLGRYQLMRLLGKSTQSMLWLAQDTRGDAEVMLAMPRRQPAGDAALVAWMQRVRRTTRLVHPQLAPVLDVGEHDRWPFIVYERGEFATWPERIGNGGLAAADLAAWSVQVLRGLAFAHEAGMAHRDVQPFSLLANEAGKVLLLGLEVADALPLPGPAEPETLTGTPGAQAASDERRQQRGAAEQDVLALGLVMHQGLAGGAPLDEPDVGRVINRLPPIGRDFVRLPWSVPRPIPEPLRAIVNRATDRQPRQRYRSARTLQRALEGWLQASASQDVGPIGLLLERLRSLGLLPGMPGGADRVARMAMLERGHTTEIADLVLQDFGLAFELLRAVNLAQANAGNASNGPILSTQRAIAMLGLEGVRRSALSLRAWPGPLNEAAAVQLEALIRRVRRAGEIARRLQPAGYDGEVVYLITALQNLGWLAVQYHFPDEATQIRRLMQPAASPRAGEPDEPGMSAEAASFAVLGVDIEVLGTAVMRHWGLDDSVQHMVRRISAAAPVRTPESDDEILRTVASCANEALDALGQPAHHVGAALHRIVQRYARPLNLTPKDLQEAVLPGSGSAPAAGPARAAAAPPRPQPAPAARPAKQARAA